MDSAEHEPADDSGARPRDSGRFCFSGGRRHTRWNCDWSSDVCSSDLCPNVDEAPETSAELVAAARAATKMPLYAKLSPAQWDVAAGARAVVDAGADGLSLVNRSEERRVGKGCSSRGPP